MKKNILLILLVFSIALSLSACSSKKVSDNNLEITEETKNLVTTYIESNISQL